jgi:hypothetical protein
MLESRAMKRLPPVALAAAALVATARPAAAQDTDPAFLPKKSGQVSFGLDALARQEWTQDIVPPATQPDAPTKEDRWRIRLQPRLELGAGRLQLGVGGDFNFGNKENVTDPRPALIRDNYDAKDARLDLAYADLDLGAVRLQGGRFRMPIGFTEMIWDRDLRPQGGAASVVLKNLTGIEQLSGTVLYGQGSHVFEDDDVKMYAASGSLVFATGETSKLELTASWIKFDGLNAETGLEPMIRRQNSRVAGAPAPAPLALEYQVVDGVARLRNEGGVNTQIVVDYCWNTKADADNKGLWLALVLGSLKTSLGRLEYTYAKVDKDATVAAYATDDFFWATGWEGHRLDLGFKASERSSIHGIGQLQRFKDSPREAEREEWVKRYRLELRISL